MQENPSGDDDYEVESFFRICFIILKALTIAQSLCFRTESCTSGWLIGLFQLLPHNPGACSHKYEIPARNILH